MYLIIIIFSSLFFFSSTNFATPRFSPDQDIESVLKKHNVQGTMIISSLDNQTTYIHNQKRAKERLSPASTFKILNSIIALEEEAIKDQYEIIKWDSTKRFLESWNKDQDMKSAFQNSCVWFYQELAKIIGKEKYVTQLNQFNYGNKLIGDDITSFWLDGSLKISPLEQIQFLKNIYQKQFKIAVRTYDILQDIMLEESHTNYKLYAKTGATASRDWIGHGWYVGYLTTKEQTWFFATNIFLGGVDDLQKRKSITIEVLKKKGII